MILTGWWEDTQIALSRAASWLGGVGGHVEGAILALTTSVWIYPGIFAVTVIDGIFPPIPSESIVIAASTTWAQQGTPVIWGVFLVAAAGAWCGDQIAYSIGRAINVRSIPFLMSKRGRATLDWAEHALEHRGTAFILAARFIPVGRVAVNLTAGALRYPRRRFMAVDAVAAVVWAAYGCVLGVFAGNLIHDNLLLAISIGVVGGIVLGVVVDRVLSRFGLAEPDLPNLDELPEYHRKRHSDAAAQGAATTAKQEKTEPKPKPKAKPKRTPASSL